MNKESVGEAITQEAKESDTEAFGEEKKEGVTR